MLDTKHQNYAVERLEIAMKEWQIPESMRDGLRLYLSDGIEPGSFLSACLCNDFKGACFAADSHNVLILKQYAGVIVNSMPSASQGDNERFMKWVAHGGLKGKTRGEA